ncbi:hypothetical protein AMJ71_06870 [candidate division TA06 bacterium SM1_40]|uniref:Polyamine aminopropyltransferase n=3 Tax=Bacteria division TA06 TaxID=1156500 RepID=A0A0S8JI57_UNCT6|nr:MAG: hypothetical protein AMJ82_08230 [candidate division TA06 bacterium SM23_40]KPL09274.1 MAG: hypothetical protein AMJ71_06870 [candidate division TA06 bacterium SM1_40]
MLVRGRLAFSLVIMGFGAMVGQLVLMREIIVAFYGNELSLGAILASWLLWVGLGSAVGARIVGVVVRSRLVAYGLAQAALALLVPISLVAARTVKSALGVGPGEVVGIGPMLFSSFVLLAPLCLSVGATFALACRLAGGEQRTMAAEIGWVYYLEAGGSVLGGIAFTFILIRLFPPLTIAIVAFLLNAVAALGVLAFRYRASIVYPLLILGSVSAASIAQVTGLVDRLDLGLLRRQWSGFQLQKVRDSIYGQVVVVGDEYQTSLYESGLLVLTYPDRATAEEAVHFALLEHPDPRKILLIGGGAGGSLEEVLKHGVESVDYVELDPTIISMAREFFGADVRRTLDDSRIRVIEGDGRWYVKRTRSRYDAVILDLPEPYTAQINRFYTREFFREVSSIMEAGGIFALRVASAENYIAPELARFLRCLRATLESVFVNVEVLPGETNIFVASSQSGLLTSDYRVLSERMERRQLETTYVSPHSLPFRLDPGRVRYLHDRMSQGPAVRQNTDLYPISYYYDMILWSSRFQSGERVLLERLAGLHLWQIAVAIAVATACIALAVMKLPSARGIGILVSVGTTGAAEIVFEVIALLSFQIIYGYVYARLGIILAAFMFGLVLGSVVSTRRLVPSAARWRLYGINQLIITLYPLIFLGILGILMGWQTKGATFGAAEWIIPLLTGIAGLLGGVQFPLAVGLYLDVRPRTRHIGGITYAIDLFGAAAGAFVASAIALPVLGIPGTLVGVFLLNCSALILIGLTAARPRSGLWMAVP